jgi:hypothetical protein
MSLIVLGEAHQWIGSDSNFFKTTVYQKFGSDKKIETSLMTCVSFLCIKEMHLNKHASLFTYSDKVCLRFYVKGDVC